MARPFRNVDLLLEQTRTLTPDQRANVYAFLAGCYAECTTATEFAETLLDAMYAAPIPPNPARLPS